MLADLLQTQNSLCQYQCTFHWSDVGVVKHTPNSGCGLVIFELWKFSQNLCS